MAVGKHRVDNTAVRRRGWLRVAGAVLLAGSASIHLYLFLTGYRSIPIIGWLFLLQVIVAFVLAAGALVTFSRVAAAAGAAFALSTLGCYLLAVWIGLFGFREVRTRAGLAAGLIEVAAFATLAMVAFIPDAARQARPRTRPGTRILAGVQRAASMVIGAVGAVSVLALVLFGVALAGAGGSSAASAATVMLRAARIGDRTVLTNAHGRTLYLFAPDTAKTSRCTGLCTAYWPPVTGSPKAGPGVTGRLGTITRPDGAVQATYDGHPLYTYIGDTSPGQEQGNNLDLNGGLWYVVPVSG
jgi:predicted lipoprotein with Yx(FWY)xxD motif